MSDFRFRRDGEIKPREQMERAASAHDVPDEAVLAVAKKAIERKTGARGLRSILEKTMTDIMFEIPSRKDIEKCIITKNTVEGTAPPTLVYRERPAELMPPVQEKVS